jgi:hypothetical protein
VDRTIALSLLDDVIQASHCDYDKIIAVELGGFRGAGLFDLFKAAAFFRTEFEIEIDVYGLMLQGSLPWLTTKIAQSIPDRRIQYGRPKPPSAIGYQILPTL